MRLMLLHSAIVEAFGKRDLKKLNAPFAIGSGSATYAKAAGGYLRKNPKTGRMVRVGGVKNKVNTATLSRAVKHHAETMGGERWPDLEQAFVKRSVTFKGTGGDYVRPRTSLLHYLSNLSEPWPEGEALAKSMLDADIARRHPRIGPTAKNEKYLMGRGEGELAKRLMTQDTYNGSFGRALDRLQERRGNKRWPELEGLLDDGKYNIDKIVEYMAAIDEPWPRGKAIVDTAIQEAIDDPESAYRHILSIPEFGDYVMANHKDNPELLVRIATSLVRVGVGRSDNFHQIISDTGILSYMADHELDDDVQELLRLNPRLRDLLPSDVDQTAYPEYFYAQ